MAEGKAEAILAVLAARNLAVASEIRTAITSCSDVSMRDHRIRRAATAVSAEESIRGSGSQI